MQRVKQHRRVLKGLVKDVRLTPSRAILAEYLLMVLDSKDDDTRRRYEIGTLAHAGGPKLVEVFLSQVERDTDRTTQPMLRNYLNVKPESHQSTQNLLQRDTRSLPNARLNLAIASMVQDANTLHERLFYDTLYLAGCLDVRGQIKLVGLDETALAGTNSTPGDRAIHEELGGFNKFLNTIKRGLSDETSNEG